MLKLQVKCLERSRKGSLPYELYKFYTLVIQESDCRREYALEVQLRSNWQSMSTKDVRIIFQM